MPFHILDGVSLFYELWGSNGAEDEVIVLVHSKKCPSLIWYQQIPFFVEKGYSVLTFDMRGFGRSTISSESRATSELAEIIHPRHFPEDLASLMDHIGIKSAHICCLALGGWTGLPFTIRYRERVRSLILCCTPGGLIPEYIRQDREACLAQEGNYSDLNQSYASKPSALSLSAFLEDSELAPGFATRFPEKALLWRQLCRSHLSSISHPDYGRLMYDAFVSSEDARMITNPSLMIASDQDLSWSVQSLRQIASMIGPSGAKFFCAKDAGHSLPFELPDVFNEIVVRFIQQSCPSSSSPSNSSSSSSSSNSILRTDISPCRFG